MANASIATSEKIKSKETGQVNELTEFHNIVIWGPRAETFCKYTSKGKLVMVDGKMTTRNYTDKNGVKRYVTEVLVNDFEFLSPADKTEASKSEQSYNQQVEANSYVQDQDFDNTVNQVSEDEQAPIDDLECPF